MDVPAVLKGDRVNAFGDGRHRESVLAERRGEPVPVDPLQQLAATGRALFSCRRCGAAGDHFTVSCPHASSAVAVLSPKPDLIPFSKACSGMDLMAIHQILMKTIYEDDIESQGMDAKQQGDSAFVLENFTLAAKCYSQFIEEGMQISPVVYARQSLCYLLNNQPGEALQNAVEAASVDRDWPTALYLQSVALAKLNKAEDAAAMLNKAAEIEKTRL